MKNLQIVCAVLLASLCCFAGCSGDSNSEFEKAKTSPYTKAEFKSLLDQLDLDAPNYNGEKATKVFGILAKDPRVTIDMLVANFDDERLCQRIFAVESAVKPGEKAPKDLPIGYNCYRFAADRLCPAEGKLSYAAYPEYLDSPEQFKKWWAKNRTRPIRELQIEILEKQIADDKKRAEKTSEPLSFLAKHRIKILKELKAKPVK